MSNLLTPKGLKIVLPKEKTVINPIEIFEGLKITQVGSPQSTVFINCVLLVYEDELLIYQKRLFSKKCSLRFYIKFIDGDEISELNLVKDFFKGALSFKLSRKSIISTKDKDEYSYKIPLPDSSWLTQGQYLSFNLPNMIYSR